MSAVAQPAQYMQIANYTHSGVSGESEFISSRLQELKRRKGETISFGDSADLKSQIIETQKECSGAGWDGFGAKPISRGAAMAAVHLAGLLPDGILEPEPVPEPSGSIGIEWINTSGSRFLLTPKGRELIYAAILGQKIIHGKVGMTDELPGEITQNLLQYFAK
jgi:hypothetical protein